MKKQICDVKYSLEDVIKNGSGFGEEAEDFATKSILEAEDERILKEVENYLEEGDLNVSDIARQLNINGHTTKSLVNEARLFRFRA